MSSRFQYWVPMGPLLCNHMALFLFNISVLNQVTRYMLHSNLSHRTSYISVTKSLKHWKKLLQDGITFAISHFNSLVHFMYLGSNLFLHGDILNPAWRLNMQWYILLHYTMNSSWMWATIGPKWTNRRTDHVTNCLKLHSMSWFTSQSEHTEVIITMTWNFVVVTINQSINQYILLSAVDNIHDIHNI